MTRTIDLGSYITALCSNLADVQSASNRSVQLICNCEAANLDLDVVTALGIVVAELVTNSYDHAFPDGTGSITVSLHRDAAVEDSALLVVSDTGCGFVPQTESKRHGLGLVRRLVLQSRGKVTLNSERGTVWSISFPISTLTGQPDLA